MLGLRLVFAVFGLPIPPPVQPLMIMAHSENEITALLADLIHGDAVVVPGEQQQHQLQTLSFPKAWSPWQVARFQQRCLRQGGDRWRYSIHLLKEFFVPNSQDQSFLGLPPLLYPFYYGIRPLRLLIKSLR